MARQHAGIMGRWLAGGDQQQTHTQRQSLPSGLGIGLAQLYAALRANVWPEVGLTDKRAACWTPKN